MIHPAGKRTGVGNVLDLYRMPRLHRRRSAGHGSSPASTRQAERAVQDLNALGNRLKMLLARSG